MKKRKEATLKQWAELYDAAVSIRRLEPWRYLSIEHLTVIELETGQEPVYLSAMCSPDGCGSISVYEGQRGYEDIRELLSIDEYDPVYAAFVLMHQSCLALHFTEREAVPPEQKDRMKRLGLRFRGKGNWPVFLSMKKRFVPYGLDQQEVIRMTLALQGYVMAIRSHIEQGLKVDWENGESLFRAYSETQKLWINFPYKLSPTERNYPGVVITDELLKKRLQKTKKNHANILMDLVYMNEMVEDEQWDRPINPLMFIAVDRESGMILDMKLLDPEQQEADAMMEFMLCYIHEHGRMKSVTARNLWLLSPLVNMSRICGFKLIEGNNRNMEPLDEALAGFFDMMDGDDEEMDAMLEAMLESMVDDGDDDDDFDGPF